MIQRRERFAVNVAPAEPGPRLQDSRPRLAPAAVPLMLALLLGAGIGGLVPTTVPPFGHLTDAGIEPAAGPDPALVPDQLLVTRAPDGGFYLSAALDRVPVVVRLEPTRPHSVLRRDDAARLAPAGPIAPTLQVGQLALGGLLSGPVTLRVDHGDAPASILGADILDRFTIGGVDGDRLRLMGR